MKYLIKVGSITNAQRANAVLFSRGYRSAVRKLEKPSQEDGCGWAVEVQSNNGAPVNILTQSGITVRGVSTLGLS